MKRLLYKISNYKKFLTVFTSVFVAFVLITVAIFLCSCSLFPEEDIVVNENLVIIDDEAMSENVLEVQPDYMIVDQVLGIKKDSILSSGVTEKTPDGLLKKAVSVEKIDDKYKVYTQQAALTDAIKKCNVSYTANYKSDGTYEIVDNHSSDKSTPITNLMVQKAYADSNIGLKLDIPKNDLLTGSISYSINFDVYIDWGYIYLKLTSRIYAGTELKDFTKIDVSQDLPCPDLATIDFQIGPVPIVVTNDLGLKLTAQANLLSFKIKGGASYDKTSGFEYSSDNGVKEINEDNSKSPYFSIENEKDRFKGSLGAGLKFSYTGKLYGIAGFEIAATLQGDTNVDLKCISDADAGEGAISLAGVGSKMKGNIDAKLYVPITGHLVVSVNIFDGLIKADLLDQELFNTGDAITIWQLHLKYGDTQNDPDFNPTNQVVLVLDVSGSMSGAPLAALKSACHRFVNETSNFNCSLSIVEFESKASVLVKNTNDTNLLSNTINGLKDKGTTNMEDGLLKAESILNDGNNTKKSIVLMSDGMPNEGKTDSALTSYAGSLKNKGISIYSLGFFHSVKSGKANAQKLLDNISSPGFHYEVDNTSSLEAFFADIAIQIGGGRAYYVQAACPVDVTVTYNGETLSSVGTTVSSRASFGTLTFSEENLASTNSNSGSTGSSSSSNQYSGSSANSTSASSGTTKILRLKEGPAYDIKITGNGTGTMNYKIGYLNLDGQYDDMRYFNNLNINPQTSISTQAKLTDTNEMVVDSNGDGKNVVKYEAGSNQQANVVTNDNKEANSNNNDNNQVEIYDDYQPGFFESIFSGIGDFFNGIFDSIWYSFNWS